MKKFFALMLTVAMLLVAGSAMAVTVTANPTSVAIDLATDSQGVSYVRATAAHNGNIALSIASDTGAGARVSGTTAEGTGIVFIPAEVGNYEVVVRASETFTSGDVAGHSTITESATVTINVAVTRTTSPNPSGGSQAATQQVKVVVNKIAVKVINVQYAVKARFSDIIKAVAEAVRTQMTARRTSILSFIGNLIGISNLQGDIMDGNNLEEATTATYNPNDDEGNLRNAAAKLRSKSGADTKRAIGVVAPFKPKKTGLQPLPLPKFVVAMYGKKPGLYMGEAAVSGGSFRAAADEVNNAGVFLDSTGASTDVVPGEGGTANAGELTAVVYVEEGKTYEPVIYTEVSPADAAAFDRDTGTTTQTAEVAEEVTVYATATFNPAVDANIIDAVEAKFGASLDKLPNDAAGEGWTTTAAEKASMTEQKLVTVCSLPQLSGITDGSYIAEIIFDYTPSADNTVGAPNFYPDGIVEGAAKSSLFHYDATAQSATLIDATNAKTYIKSGNKAYLVFQVLGDAVVKASAGADLTKPSIMVKSEGHDTTPTDPVIKALVDKKYVIGTTIQPAGFASDSVTFDGSTTSGIVKLNFDVVSSSWRIDIDGGYVIRPSAAGTITGNTERQATVALNPDQISENPLGRAVTLTVRPKSGDLVASSDVTAVVGRVYGTSSELAPDEGVGSSSGGCSAGSAVLAMAVLGAFIASRKK